MANLYSVAGRERIYSQGVGAPEALLGYHSRMDSQQHPLGFSARVGRTDRWGTPTEKSAHLAERIVREFERRSSIPLSANRSQLKHGPMKVRESRADATSVEAVSRIASTTTADDVRAACSLGKSFPDLVAGRSGALDEVTDLVVRPSNITELARVVDQLVADDIAIVPLGGGTSVVGGVEALGSRPEQVVATIDLAGMGACLDVDAPGRIARFQAGVRGPDLERVLSGYGLTLGHVPQSFEWATLGGWIATRSAGQQSLAFGKIERMTAAVELVVPGKTISVEHLPAHGAGPGTLELLMGSEGTMGIVAEATVRLRKLPEAMRFQTYLFGGFEEAAAAGRHLVQSGLRPAVVRISDEEETAFSIGSSLPGGIVRKALSGVARLSGLAGRCMVMVIIPGDTYDAARALDGAVDACMHRCGGRAVGPYPARHWYHARFLQPYARDAMMDHGLLIDTLETAVPWGRVPEVRRGVRSALERTLGPDRTMVGCHLSHLYEDGASMYFTFMSAIDHEQQLTKWREAKRAVHEVFARHGSAVSHQHGVGTMHSDIYRSVHDERVLDAWRSARQSLVTVGHFNPGKLMDAPPRGASSLNSVTDPVPLALGTDSDIEV